MVDLLLIFQFKYNDNIYRFQFTSPFFQLVPGYVTACESFDMRSAASKQDYLLTLEVPEEMMAECGTVDELSDELVAKIGENCLDECQDLQRQAANDLLEFVYQDTILSLDSEKKSDELIKQLTTFSQAITSLAEIPQQLRELSDPEALIDSSKLKIADVFYDGLITEAQMTQMMKEVEASFAFNPAVTTTYEEILSNVKKGTLLSKTSFDIICTPYPQLMRVHLVRNSTSAKFEKSPNIHLVRIFALSD